MQQIATMQYFVVMIDYGRRGREAIVDPEITRREVISRIVSGEYKNISFIHEIADSSVEDITAIFWPRPPFPRSARQAPICRPARSITRATFANMSRQTGQRSRRRSRPDFENVIGGSFNSPAR
jgi:hypothetical protein